MRFIMRVDAGERAVCGISQQKYYNRQRYGGKRPRLVSPHLFFQTPLSHRRSNFPIICIKGRLD